MEPDAVAVVRLVVRGLRLPQSDRGARPAEIPDRLASLALDLADPVEAERREQVAVERQAALDRRDDEVDVVDAHVTPVTFRVARGLPARFRRVGALPLPPRDEPGAGGRAAVPRPPRLPADRALRADRRGPGALRVGRLAGGARAVRLPPPAL